MWPSQETFEGRYCLNPPLQVEWKLPLPPNLGWPYIRRDYMELADIAVSVPAREVENGIGYRHSSDGYDSSNEEEDEEVSGCLIPEIESGMNFETDDIKFHVI
ncbi:hypothetical protein N7457_007563 [Penicillium paradoxum]|uniref:uncharacterized protein n=1 Tax=Penicillium paradoxum TaxID=176176 RepID=UPI0025488D36|nr:uncharacterized protein N7457_007563 [Penicillium paradoxum]KAJ5779843.1 hypothetical protein N7457_007563 [Penicillium paradoxum]